MELEPNSLIGRYNLACYLAINGDAADEVLTNLSLAIDGSERHKRNATVDPDFDSVRDLPEFKALVFTEAADAGETS